MFNYEKTDRFFAQIANGLEELGAEELASLGALNVTPVFRGIVFEGDRNTLYRVNYQSRLCSRILAPLLTFDCHSTKYLYQTAIKIDWPAILKLEQTFAISAHCESSAITHSQYASLCLKDAIVDQFRELHGSRPNVEKINPDVSIHLHIGNNKATISLDTSGGSLHRRGYRQESVEAPMQETLAAAIVAESKWNGQQPLLDPMCGSGTLLAEALMKFCRIPAGYFRERFGFENMPDFDEKIWDAVTKEADENIQPLPQGLIQGSDISKIAIDSARANLNLLPGGSDIELTKCRFQDIDKVENRVIITNPPYGIRLGQKEEAGQLIGDFGDFLKHKCKGSTAFLYFGDRALLKKIGLKTSFKKPMAAGKLDGVLAKYEMY
ncbi:MAG: class I SAM-dependent RNA methyltransferase [Proteobacteria bacterium]|nr:class I SAM-dependent RNA methyltransferase [Pseudomonadota bacterium]MBU1710027.1 class I SAM-dependent RNA methyltransferase [Pseudomonadota bacterium]